MMIEMFKSFSYLSGGGTTPRLDKNAIAVAHCKRGKGILKVNGNPVHLMLPESLRSKVMEPVLLVGSDKFKEVDIRVKVRGGGNTSQVYAIRQAIAKAIVAFHQKYVDEQSKREIKDTLVQFDRSLLVADPRRCEFLTKQLLHLHPLFRALEHRWCLHLVPRHERLSSAEAATSSSDIRDEKRARSCEAGGGREEDLEDKSRGTLVSRDNLVLGPKYNLQTDWKTLGLIEISQGYVRE
eukprot:749070-Hanusia_phi.AAC.1